VSQESNSPIMRAVGVHKHYQMGRADLHVLRGVDIAAHTGEWLCILGASGSGKSTLLHLLGGLDTPDEGDVMFRDQSLFALSTAERDRFRNQHVGFVFQFYHLLPELNVVENTLISAMVGASLGVWSRQRTELRERASELLGRLGLGERLHHRPNELSGGERQRVAIARALINQPDVLLADEPTGNLDPQLSHDIMMLFRSFNECGMTVIIASHDLYLVRKLAQRVLVLQEGQLIDDVEPGAA